MRYEPKSDNVAATVIDGEAIIVNLTTGVYYSMDKVGAEVWELMSQGLSTEQIAAALEARHHVERATALNDTEQLIQKLLAEDLVCPGSGESPVVEEPVSAMDRTAYVTPAVEIYRDMGDLLALDPPMPGLRDFPPQSTPPQHQD